MKLTVAQALLASAPTLASAFPTELNARQVVDQNALYTIHPASHLNKCISVKGSEIVEGAAVDVYVWF